MQWFSQQPWFPYLLLSLATLSWAGNFIVGRAFGDTLQPVELSFWRNLLGLLLLLPWSATTMYQQRAILWAHRWNLLALGTLGVAGFNTIAYLALQNTSATNAVLLMSTTPLVILLLSYVFLNQAIRLNQVMGIMLSFAGVSIIIARGDVRQLLNLQLNIGDAWMLSGVIVWGLYSILLRWRPSALSNLTFLTTLISVGVMVLTPLYLLLHVVWFPSTWTLTLPIAGAIGYTVLFPVLLSYLCWNHGVKLVGANTAGQFIHLMPVFGTLLAVLLLGEQLFLFHWLGIICVFSGIYVATYAFKPKKI